MNTRLTPDGLIRRAGHWGAGAMVVTALTPPGDIPEPLRRELEQLRAIQSLTQALTGVQAAEAVYETALDTLEQTVHCDRASVLLFDEHGVMRFRAWRRESERYRTAVDGHSPWTADTPNPAPVLVEDVRDDPAWSNCSLSSMPRASGRSRSSR